MHACRHGGREVIFLISTGIGSRGIDCKVVAQLTKGRCLIVLKWEMNQEV